MNRVWKSFTLLVTKGGKLNFSIIFIASESFQQQFVCSSSLVRSKELFMTEKL